MNNNSIHKSSRAHEEESDSSSHYEAMMKQGDGSMSVSSGQRKKVQATVIDGKIWTEDNDRHLLKFASQYKCDWKKVAKRFPSKKFTPHFLKIRYKELQAKPVHRRSKFSHKEDLLITKYFSKYGTDWDRMANHFNDRSGTMLKNRYYAHIKKKCIYQPLLLEVKQFENTGIRVEDMPEEEPEIFDVEVGQENEIVHNDDNKYGLKSEAGRPNYGSNQIAQIMSASHQ